MADITSRYQGDVEDSDQVNWRGDQVAVPQGGQSIYKTSSVKLAELGSRKVVGDRVFRYALAGGTIAAGEAVSVPAVDAKHRGTTLASTAYAGAKTMTVILTTSAAANYFADGYVYVMSGTAGRPGIMYKVKSHGSIGDAGSGAVALYDPLLTNIATGDKIDIFPSMYSKVVQCTDQTGSPVGISPIAVVSGDYFWVQTWGVASAIAGSAGVPTQGQLITFGSAGMVETTVGATAIVGYSLQAGTATVHNPVFLTIAP